MITMAPLLLLAAAQASLSDLEAKAEAEARGGARAVLEQLLAEDGEVSHYRYGGYNEEVGIDTRPRASSHHGICQYDRLEIERDPAGSIRKVETIHHFLVLTDPRDKPRWDVEGEELEKSCAAAGESDRWFDAPEAYAAEAAVVGLLGLKAELLKPDPAPGAWGCKRRKPCPSPKAIAERIDPLVPRSVTDGGHGGVSCPKDEYCVSVLLAENDCTNWVSQLRLGRSGGFQFRSARGAYQLFVHHCGDEMLEPYAQE